MTIMPHNATLTRIRAEYLEMPGWCLTHEQMQLLDSVERTLCKRVLDALVDAKLLCVKSDGTYARLTEGEISRPPARQTSDTDDSDANVG